MILPPFSPLVHSNLPGFPKKAKNLAGKVLPLIQDRLRDAEFGKNAANLSNQFAANASRRLQFEKRGQLFIRMHNEMLFP
jgi:hypothetical protein